MSEQVANTKVHGAVEESLPSNQRVPGSSLGEAVQFVTESPKEENTKTMPVLRPYDQTPVTPSDSKTVKRSFDALSPVQESEIMTDNLWKKIEGTILSSINNAIPKIIENIVAELQCTFQSFVDTAVDQAKGEILTKVSQQIGFVDLKNDLMAKCEAEQLETYNRRDNIKILGLPENTRENGEPAGESYEHTMDKVLDLTSKLEASVDKKDLSIAHRLPSRRGNVRPVIVKFSRRVAKIDVLRKKKALYENGSNIKIFEDVSRPRVMFLNMMRQDHRISSAYTKDGAILYTRKDDNRVYKIVNLINGAYDLDYPLQDVMNCFR